METVKKMFAVISMRTGEAKWFSGDHQARQFLNDTIDEAMAWMKHFLEDDDCEALRHYFLTRHVLPRSCDFELYDYYDPDKREFWDGVPMKVKNGALMLAKDDSSYFDGHPVEGVDVSSFQNNYGGIVNVPRWLFHHGKLTRREYIAINDFGGDVRLVTDQHAKCRIAVDDYDKYHGNPDNVPDSVIDEPLSD